MVQAVESQHATSHSIDLLDDVRDAAKVGQHAAAEALRAFRKQSTRRYRRQSNRYARRSLMPRSNWLTSSSLRSFNSTET